jgi:hypothetical protein
MPFVAAPYETFINLDHVAKITARGPRTVALLSEDERELGRCNESDAMDAMSQTNMQIIQAPPGCSVLMFYDDDDGDFIVEAPLIAFGVRPHRITPFTLAGAVLTTWWAIKFPSGVVIDQYNDRFVNADAFLAERTKIFRDLGETKQEEGPCAGSSV